MSRLLILAGIYLLFTGPVAAQSPIDTTIIPVADSLGQHDTTTRKDSLTLFVLNPDSLSRRPVQPDSGWALNPGISLTSPGFSWQVLEHNPWFGFSAKPTYLVKQNIKQFTGKELIFYILIFLLILFALLRRAFPKYFNDLFRLFFRTTLKQRQIREQLMQTPLPSLLLNGFFIVSAALYISFLLRHFGFDPVGNFWLLFFYCCLGLSVAYMIKFVGLKVSGWVFNMQEAADSYIFIVFIVNKMIGILLLPFLVLLAFTLGNVYSVAMTVSWCLVGGLILYRFILTFVAIRNQVKVNPFHFLLYLIAFEIAPLLLVYKALLEFFNQST